MNWRTANRRARRKPRWPIKVTFSVQQHRPLIYKVDNIIVNPDGSVSVGVLVFDRPPEIVFREAIDAAGRTLDSGFLLAKREGVFTDAPPADYSDRARSMDWTHRA